MDFTSWFSFVIPNFSSIFGLWYFCWRYNRSHDAQNLGVGGEKNKKNPLVKTKDLLYQIQRNSDEGFKNFSISLIFIMWFGSVMRYRALRALDIQMQGNIDKVANLLHT